MLRLLAGVWLALIVLVPSDGFACRADSDCTGPARCVKTYGEREGVCERGVAPVDEQPGRHVADPERASGTEGQRCEFGGDCVEGLYCMPTSNPKIRVCRHY